MPLDAPAAGTAQKWLQRAQSSLALASQAKPDDALWEDQCYMAQQGAEKALKAVYIYHALPFRFTHDIEELCTKLTEHNIALPEVAREAVILTRYAVETRYPGLEEPVSEEEYHQAIRLTEAIVHWAVKVIV